MRLVVLLLLVAACSKHDGAPPPSAKPPIPATATAVPPAAAPVPARSFAVGDKVVLTPTNIMVISAIGSRRQLTPAGMDNVDFQPANALAGKDTMQVREPDDVQVYALRFPGEDHDSFLLEVARANEEHLRHISTSEQIDEFLRALHDSAVAARQPGFQKPDNVLRAALGAHNDLQQLARFYPLLDPKAPVEPDVIKSLDTFFVDEISTVKSISEADARAMLQAALR